jgi:hypothetical protein
MKSTKSVIKATRDLRDIPPRVFALPTDGRKQRCLCLLRKLLVNKLTSHANADGSSIYPSTFSMANALGVSVRTINRLLADLRQLGFIVDDGFHKIGEVHTRQRRLNIAKIQQAAGGTTTTAPDTTEPLRQIAEPLRQIGVPTAPNSGGTTPDSFGAQPAFEPAIQPPTQPGTGASKHSLEAWLEKESTAADTLEEALRYVPEYMLGAGFKPGEKDQLGKLIAQHGWEKFAAVAKLYGQRQDPRFFDGTMYKWTGLLPNFLALLDKVTPEMLRTQAWDRWKSTPEGASEYQRQCDDAHAAKLQYQVVPAAMPGKTEAGGVDDYSDIFGEA